MPAAKTIEHAYQPSYTLLQEAIKKVGVGRRGSTRLSAVELDRLKNKTLLNNCSAISKGAFLAALLNQGLEHGEETLVRVMTRSATDNNNNTIPPTSKKIAPILAKVFPSYPAKYVLDWLLYEDNAYEVCFTEWKSQTSLSSLDDAAVIFERWALFENNPSHTPTKLSCDEQLRKALYVILTLVHTLSKKETLTEKEAYVLGQFLLLSKPATTSASSVLPVRNAVNTTASLLYSWGAEFIRGFCMSMLRVRYETRSEWNGLYKALTATVRPLLVKNNFSARKTKEISQKWLPSKIRSDHPILILSEPMNGYTKHAFITPLLAWWSTEYLRMKAVHLTGSNPGPKFGFTFKDLATSLNLPLLSEQALAAARVRNCGVIADQSVFVPAMHAWVRRRREIVKRPAWATLEKVVNPITPITPITLLDENVATSKKVEAAYTGHMAMSDLAMPDLKRVILITSAFHGPYFEKMCDLARTAGYVGYIIVQWGTEGGLGATLSRPLKLRAGVKVNAFYPAERTAKLTSARSSTQAAYLEQDFTMSYKDIDYPRVREVYAHINADENARFVDHWLERCYTRLSNERLRLPHMSESARLYKYVCAGDLLYAGLRDDAERNFAACVRIALLGYTAALSWIEHKWAVGS